MKDSKYEQKEQPFELETSSSINFSSLKLTPERVRQKVGSNIKSALLQEVNGASIEKKNPILLLILAVLFIIFGIILQFNDLPRELIKFGFFLIFIGILFLIVWFFLRSVELVIYVGALKIKTKINGGKAAISSAIRFIDALEEAKQNIHHKFYK